MKTARRSRRSFEAHQKITAVLSIWTERRTISQVCRDMSVSHALLDRWQNQAMEGMLAALSAKKPEKPAALNARLTRLIEKKLPDPTVKLEKRLKAIQKAGKTDNPS
jgi:transposase-like protein